MSSLSLFRNSGSVEVWKCGNMSSLSMSNNSGSVEMCLHCLYLETLEVWKCGNVEICLHCLCLITLEVWKCGNMSSLSSSSERFTKNIRGAYHLTENYGNSGWKLNGKVTFRKSQPKIEEYVLTYEPNGMLLTINQFLGSRLTLQKFALFLDSNQEPITWFKP